MVILLLNGGCGCRNKQSVESQAQVEAEGVVEVGKERNGTERDELSKSMTMIRWRGVDFEPVTQ